MKDVSYGQLRRQYAIKITSKGIIGRKSLSKVLSYFQLFFNIQIQMPVFEWLGSLCIN